MKTWPVRMLVVLLLIVNALGCSGSKDGKDKGNSDNKAPQLSDRTSEKEEAAIAKTADDNNGPAAQKAVERKIIYTATLKLLVDDFSKAEEDFLRLIKEADGRVEMSDIAARSGSPRSGHW